MRVARKPRIMTEARILNWWKVERRGNGVSGIKTRTISATESGIIIEDTVKTPQYAGSDWMQGQGNDAKTKHTLRKSNSEAEKVRLNNGAILISKPEK